MVQALPTVYRRPDVSVQVTTYVDYVHPVRCHKQGFNAMTVNGTGGYVGFALRPRSFEQIRSCFVNKRAGGQNYAYYYEDLDRSPTKVWILTNGNRTLAYGGPDGNLWAQSAAQRSELNILGHSEPPYFALGLTGFSTSWSKNFQYVLNTGQQGNSIYGKKGWVHYGRHIEGGTELDVGEFYMVESEGFPGIFSATTYEYGSLGLDVYDWRDFIGGVHRHRNFADATGQGTPHQPFKTYEDFLKAEAKGEPLGEAMPIHNWGEWEGNGHRAGPRGGRLRNLTDGVYEGTGVAGQQWRTTRGPYFDDTAKYGPEGYVLDFDVKPDLRGSWYGSGGDGGTSGGFTGYGGTGSGGYKYPLKHVMPMQFATSWDGSRDSVIGLDGGGNIVFCRSGGYRKVLCNTTGYVTQMVAKGGGGLTVYAVIDGWKHIIHDPDPNTDKGAPRVNDAGEIQPPETFDRSADPDLRRVSYW